MGGERETVQPRPPGLDLAGRRLYAAGALLLTVAAGLLVVEAESLLPAARRWAAVLTAASAGLALVAWLLARRRAEAALRAAEAHHLAVVRNLPVVQWVIGGDGRFTLSVGGALPKLGLAEGQVVGQPVEAVYAGQPDVLRDYHRALAGETFTAVNDFGPVVFESRWAPVRDAAGRVVGVSGQALDVSERIRAERDKAESDARLASLERMAAMGQVAAGVAHEINNPLTYVLGALDEAAEALRRGEVAGVPGLVAEARGGAERVRRIVGDLRLFARQGGDAAGTCDASAVARVAAAMLQNEIRHRARLELALPASAQAAIPEHRLVQVLVNLLMNACHAVGEGHAGAHRIGLAVCRDGGRVVVEVRDTGVGMEPAVRARIFEPFFTTRKVGEGMGLGLALCQAMVVEAGGRIEVESTPGEGSLFRVVLLEAADLASVPEASASSAPSSRPAPPEGERGAEAPPLRILVIDDEPMVGRAVARLLGRHAVEQVTSGAQALERVRAGPAYQAIVCDLMMPDMTGMELHERLAGEAPDAARRMIFLTGGAFTERARAFVDRGGVRVLEKPVDADLLREAVAAVATAA